MWEVSEVWKNMNLKIDMWRCEALGPQRSLFLKWEWEWQCEWYVIVIYVYIYMYTYLCVCVSRGWWWWRSYEISKCDEGKWHVLLWEYIGIGILFKKVVICARNVHVSPMEWYCESLLFHIVILPDKIICFGRVLYPLVCVYIYICVCVFATG